MYNETPAMSTRAALSIPQSIRLGSPLAMMDVVWIVRRRVVSLAFECYTACSIGSKTIAIPPESCLVDQLACSLSNPVIQEVSFG